MNGLNIELENFAIASGTKVSLLKAEGKPVDHDGISFTVPVPGDLVSSGLVGQTVT